MSSFVPVSGLHVIFVIAGPVKMLSKFEAALKFRPSADHDPPHSSVGRMGYVTGNDGRQLDNYHFGIDEWKIRDGAIHSRRRLFPVCGCW